MTTQKKESYDAKWEEIELLFKEANPGWRGSFKYEYLRHSGSGASISTCPSQYPKGVKLILRRRCPRCSEEKDIESQIWKINIGPSSANISWAPGALGPGTRKQYIKHQNPGICSDCVNDLYLEKPAKHDEAGMLSWMLNGMK